MRTHGLAKAALMRIRHAGFTLLEMVTVLAVLAILLSVAVPTYQKYLIRVHRTEAVSALLQVASCQEIVFASRGQYDTTRCAPSGLEHYSIRLEPGDTPASPDFVAWADPAGAQADDPCGSLGLDQTGLRRVSGNEVDAGNCWRAGRY